MRGPVHIVCGREGPPIRPSPCGGTTVSAKENINMCTRHRCHNSTPLDRTIRFSILDDRLCLKDGHTVRKVLTFPSPHSRVHLSVLDLFKKEGHRCSLCIKQLAYIQVPMLSKRHAPIVHTDMHTHAHSHTHSQLFFWSVSRTCRCVVLGLLVGGARARRPSRATASC